MADEMSPLRARRREKILNAAERLFVAKGVQATTFERLAAEAGMSKVTVYGYFKEKDAVFAAVADRVAVRLFEAFSSALEGEGTVRDRVGNALIAKHRVVQRLVRESDHAQELFEAKSRTSSDRFLSTDADMINCIAKELASVTKNPKEMAALLFDASQGIANGADEFGRTERCIRSLMCLIDLEIGKE